MLYKDSSHSDWFGIYMTAAFLSIIIAIAGCSVSSEMSPEKKYSVDINSCIVRDRVIPLDHLVVKSTAIVGFKILPEIENCSGLIIKGDLYLDHKLLSEDEIVKPDCKVDNLGFDIPLSEGPYDQPLIITDGKYRIVIKVLDEKNHLVAQAEKALERNQIGRTFNGFDKVYAQPKYILIRDEKTIKGDRLKAEGSEKTKTKEYVIFQKSYLERVYPNTQPKVEELVTELSTEISRNETKPLAFAIQAKKDLGKVKMVIVQLKDKQGKPSKVDIQISAVNQLTEVVKDDKKTKTVYYRYAPKIIEDKEVIVPQNQTQTYWITIRANHDTKPGDYNWSIKVIPQSGKHTEIPIHIKVLPITLTDTDKQYGMMMDYAFYELDNETWKERDRDILKKRGMEIYRDLREHGMTVIYPHSHFYYKTDKNGEPILNSLKASLESYKNLEFPGPFVWYLGHLLQTAKPKHPGSILNYDPDVAERRLRDLLIRFEAMARDLGIPKDKLIVQLVDEPDPDQKERTKAGKELHKVAKQLGFKTLITRPWTDVDVICTGTPDNEKQAEQLRKMGKEWWIYPNDTLASKNLAYTRYVFGFGAWRWDVDGVVPWTYQMSQGSNGNPFTVLDGPEVMVAYPGLNGPVPTPTWEAIRDGINDYKYIYLLEKLISAEKAKGNSSALSIEQQLMKMKKNLEKPPGPEGSDFGDWPPETFEKKRAQIVEWLLQLVSTT